MPGTDGDGSDLKTLKVVSYNILTPPYVRPPVLPEHADAETRFKMIMSKLDKQIDADRPVIGLQEVSLGWRGLLEVYFAKKGYGCIATNYSRASSDYMGVLLAYPMEKFSLSTCDIKTVASTKPCPPKVDKVVPEPTQPGVLCSVGNWIWGAGAYLADVVVTITAMKLLYRTLVPKKPLPPATSHADDMWKNALRRANRLITLGLSPADAPGSTVWVATYHMPCAFRDPDVMVAHAALAVQHVQKLAAGQPVVLLGDFNLKHGDPGYKLITEGDLPKDHEGYPEPHWETDPWMPRLSAPMASLYKAINGVEPELTNYNNMNGDIFADTLDYIFYHNCSPVSCIPLPPKADLSPSPNADEPSDHLLVGGTLAFPSA